MQDMLLVIPLYKLPVAKPEDSLPEVSAATHPVLTVQKMRNLSNNYQTTINIHHG